jgi:hypothetical protein
VQEPHHLWLRVHADGIARTFDHLRAGTLTGTSVSALAGSGRNVANLDLSCAIALRHARVIRSQFMLCVSRLRRALEIEFPPRPTR